MRVGVDTSVFETFPEYRRGLVIARGVVNRAEDPALEARLRAAEQAVREHLAGVDWRAHPRLAVWIEAFDRLGVGVGSRPPSVVALVKRVVKGGSLPFISQLVALMNVVSLENLVPCGGDDLDAVAGEIMLRPAFGTESYSPLGRPDVVEHPDPGELVLVDDALGTVLCRTWLWRNSDVTKLTESTTTAALNVDLMSSAVSPADGDDITRRLADHVRRHCGGEVGWYMIRRDRPAVEVSPQDPVA